MYAIIRSGGKQTKVREGDVIDVERVRADGEISFTPLLVVDGKGKVYSSRDELKSAKVTAKVVGESSGDKVEIFKYKAKTGYRRRGGHRQKYTTLEVTKIEAPKKAAAKSSAAAEPDPKPEPDKAAPKAPAAAKPVAKPAPKQAAAKKPAAKKPAAAKEPAAKKSSAAKKPVAKKPAAKKPAPKKSSAAKPKTEKES